jgi:chemotaxis protein methyltransferase CheR
LANPLLEKTLQIKNDEMELLLSEIRNRYGYDFTGYSRASLKRRIDRLLSLDKFSSIAEFRHCLQQDANYLNRFVEEVTVNVTEMFRDPSFYKALRTDVLPVLATYPFIRIWHAGCSTGEEVYSMAILLQEANLLHKSRIYATDVHPGALDMLRKGMFPMVNMKKYTENYIESGGTYDFSQYYTTQKNLAKFDQSFSKKMIVSTHNLTSDSAFNEFELICCRNVLIYFEKNLQDRVLTLFTGSIEKTGFLALGSKESLTSSAVSDQFKEFTHEKIWRKIK